jgi:acyl-coenzyme A synthetase/AMP-(fatty) acid ligase
VTELRERLVAGSDGDLALISDQGTLTFRALRERLAVTAAALFAPAGKRLAFCFLPNGTDLAVAYLSAMVHGHAAGLFPSQLPPGRRERLIAAYRPEVVLVTDDDQSGFLTANGYRPVGLPGAADGTRCWSTGTAGPGGSLHPDLALLLSTSGSTGTPKLVRLSADGVIANARGIAETLRIGPRQRAVTSLPVCYSYGLSILGSHLAAGAAVAVTGLSPVTSPFWQFVHRHEVVEVGGTPLTHRAILTRRAARPLPPSVLVMTQAGGRLGTGLARQALAWTRESGGRFYCMYGQTEATARISCLDAPRLADKMGSAGTALPGGRISIAPPATAAPADGTGEIRYAGPSVMMGYAADRDDLARGHEVSILATGDLGRLDADGFLYVTGRSSRFTKVADRRVSLDDVEEWLGCGQDCAAVAAGGESPAILIFAAGREDRIGPASRALAAALGAPPSAIAVRQVESLPRTAAGKVDYGRLQRMAAAR